MDTLYVIQVTSQHTERYIGLHEAYYVSKNYLKHTDSFYTIWPTQIETC